jgi:2-iminobutanoate/2-iminopropanoate deaminase
MTPPHTVQQPMTSPASPDPASTARRWQPVSLGEDVPAPKGAYSRGIRAGDFLYVSGQVPLDPRTGQLVGGGDVTAQARQTLDNLRGVLDAGGATFADVVSVAVHLANIDDWGAFDAVYRQTFTEPFPTRTVVGAELRGFLVEVTAVAYVGGRG